MVASPLPEWLAVWAKRLQAEVGGLPVAPNHVLVNEYRPGQGIMAHEDGPMYLPLVAVLNIGADIMLDFYPIPRDAAEPPAVPTLPSPHDAPDSGSQNLPPAASICAERRSLYVFTGAAYTEFRHGIAERTEDKRADGLQEARGTRISLTFRVVRKVLKAKLRL